MFLHNPRAYEQGHICIYGFMSKIYLSKRFWRFKNHTRAVKKTEKTRFRVPIHFATNRFTFEKNPPPPPLLHPTKCLVLQVAAPTFASPTYDSIAAAPQAQTHSGVTTLHLQSLVSTLTFASLTRSGFSLKERLQEHHLAQIECFKLE